MRLTVGIVALLCACSDERGPRAAPDSVFFSGWIYPDASAVEDGEPLSDAEVVFTPEAAEAVEATQPYADYPGYWSVELPPDVPITVRITSGDAYPAVWAADAPGANGQWLAGTLFGADRAWIDAFFAEVAAAAAVELPALGADTTHVWGAPLDGSAWDCAAVRVAGVQPVCLGTDADGNTALVDEGPFGTFFAFGVAAGAVTVEAPGLVETYLAEGGDVVHAFWLVPSQEQAP